MDKVISGVSLIISGIITIVTTNILDPPKLIALQSTWCSTVTPPPPDYLNLGLVVIGISLITIGVITLFVMTLIEKDLI